MVKVKSSRKKDEPKIKRSLPPTNDDDNDDDSVDSKGNIRELIDYSDEESVLSSPRPMKRKPRRAALRAIESFKRIKNKEDDEDENENEDTYQPKNEIIKSNNDDNDDNDDNDEEEEDEEEYDEDEDDEEEDDEEDNEYDEYEDEEYNDNDKNIAKIIFGYGGLDEEDRFKPKRHKLEEEPEEVKKFVDLLSKSNEQSTIDDQIDYFKKLEKTVQSKVIEALERKPDNSQESMMFRILSMNVSPDIQTKLLSKYNTLQMMDSSSGEYFKNRAWLEKVVSVPFGIYKELPATLDDGPEKCHDFMKKAQNCLAEAIYGQEEAKLQILQFIATKLANPQGRGLSLLLSGSPGIGKTSLIKNGISKSLEWPFEFISLGGDSDATTYTGHQMVYEGSHCGKIVNSIITAKSMSMVMMFDELDKISATPKGEEVQNLLIHLTDSVQNSDFEDKYISGIPIDLSKIMFVFSANDLSKIDKVLLDRMIVIELKGYNSKDKAEIAKNFLVPNALKEVNLIDKVTFSKEIIDYILSNYCKEEPGVREFKRAIEQVVQKINMLRIFNSKDMPFYIENFSLPFVIEKKHIDLFLKRRTTSEDTSYLKMYI
jgi:ATP-dependent Lon protease